MKNRYGHEIINFPRKQTFKKWVLGLSKEERVKLEALIENRENISKCPNCPMAKFLSYYTGKDIICTRISWWEKGKYITQKLPDWAKEFIQSFDSGKIQNLRQWASQKDS